MSISVFLIFLTSCTVQFSCSFVSLCFFAKSFSYPFSWHISREFYALSLSLPARVRWRCALRSSLLKKSEETRAQFPHLLGPSGLPSLYPHSPPLVFVAFLAFLLHSTCVSGIFFCLLFLFATTRTRTGSRYASNRLATRLVWSVIVVKCSPI